MEINLKDLPIGFKFSCDHPDNLHFGLESRNGRSWNQKKYHIGITNIECKNRKVKIWSTGSDFATSPSDQVILWINKNRRVEYYKNRILQSSGNRIDKSKFPLDLAISPPDNNHHGFLRNIGYVSDPNTGECVKGILSAYSSH